MKHTSTTLATYQLIAVNMSIPHLFQAINSSSFQHVNSSCVQSIISSHGILGTVQHIAVNLSTPQSSAQHRQPISSTDRPIISQCNKFLSRDVHTCRGCIPPFPGDPPVARFSCLTRICFPRGFPPLSRLIPQLPLSLKARLTFEIVKNKS